MRSCKKQSGYVRLQKEHQSDLGKILSVCISRRYSYTEKETPEPDAHRDIIQSVTCTPDPGTLHYFTSYKASMPRRLPAARTA
jgi:hypothetical protein